MSVSESVPIILTPELTVDGHNPIVVIGPNGSGKTRFGYQVARQNEVEIVAALRNIELGADVPMQSITQAENELNNQKQRRSQRPWSLSNEINSLFAKLMAEDSAGAIEFREDYFRHSEATPKETKLMRLATIWGRLFPGRHISFAGYVPKVVSEYVAGEVEYPAQQMSDGERVALYLAARVLDAKTAIIVIDEPEVHFHSRLATRFWDELEALRPECRFMYITHDLPFALSRNTDQFVLVKPGVQPEMISLTSTIPANLSESILAAASVSIFARRLVFCEGTESSYDQAILRAWFNDRNTAVVPVGACRDVIRCTRTFRDEGLVTGLTAYGIIDRDYWPDTFLEAVPESITVLPCHEIESLLCRRGLFMAVAGHHGLSAEDANKKYQEFLTEARKKFTGGLFAKQVSERFRCRCEGQVRSVMNGLSALADLNETRVKHCEALAPDKWQIAPEDLFDTETQRLENALGASEDQFLLLFPGKVYFASLVGKLGLTKEAYIDLLVRALTAAPDSNLTSLGNEIAENLGTIFPERSVGQDGSEGG